MSILVINVGSSSLKYKLFDEASENVLKEGEVQHSGENGLEKIVKTILRGIGNIGDIELVVHRVVHGGPHPHAIQKLSLPTLRNLEQWNFLAPLHNPPAIEAARLFLDYLPGVKHVAVFDSGFFRALPMVAKTYSLPLEVSKRFGIERIGFHGVSHEYACREACLKLKVPFEKATLISFHLGGGASGCVVSRGKPFDTSMGLTPLGGLPMMTRSGDLDPGIVLFLLKKHFEEKVNTLYPLSSSDLIGGSRKKNKQKQTVIASEAWRSRLGAPNGIASSVRLPHNDKSFSFGFLDSHLHGNDSKGIEWLEHILNEESGLKGLSGKENFLDILRDYQFDERAKFAFDFFVYHIRKYIGSYLSVLSGKPDAIVFTGAIGAGDALLRKAVMKDLWVAKGVKTIVVKPDEELAMMRKVMDHGTRTMDH